MFLFFVKNGLATKRFFLPNQERTTRFVFHLGPNRGTSLQIIFCVPFNFKQVANGVSRCVKKAVTGLSWFQHVGESVVLPRCSAFSMRSISPSQNSAPAHCAHHQTMQLLLHETPDFIAPDLWPVATEQTGPDTSLILDLGHHASACSSMCMTVPSIMWKNLNSNRLESGEDCSRTLLTVSEWRKRLRACIHAQDPILST